MFKLIIYTSGDQRYADAIVDAIDPERFIKKRLYRFDLVWEGGSIYIDMSKFTENFDMCLLIDDSVGYIKQKENLIEVSPFYGYDNHDRCLKNLIEVFQSGLRGNDDKFDLRALPVKIKEIFPTPSSLSKRRHNPNL